MACASELLSLPTELIVNIVKYCEKYDYPYDHNAKSMGRRDCPVFKPHQVMQYFMPVLAHRGR